MAEGDRPVSWISLSFCLSRSRGRAGRRVGGSCPGVGSLRSEATWPARRSDIPRPLQFSVRSFLSLSLCLPSLLHPFVFLSHFNACPCPLLSSLPPPSLRLALYLSLHLSRMLLVAPAPGSRRDSPLRIHGGFVNAPPSSSSPARGAYVHSYALREKEGEGGIRSATFRRARSSPCRGTRCSELCARPPDAGAESKRENGGNARLCVPRIRGCQ